jgi:phosphopantothenoylcysteine decarboxylase/phosphopantothenate--cysteine ligase
MGYALAAEARLRGAHVTVIAGPTQLAPPPVDDVVRVRSAADMHAAVMRAAPGADVIIMSAAVADYTPGAAAAGKITKTDSPMTLTLQRTPDILADLGRMPSRAAGRPILVGFAAETSDLLEKARAKRARKNVDLIVGNDVSRSDAGFDVATNAVILVDAHGEQELPLQSKAAIAAAVLDRVEHIIRARIPTPAGA